MAHKLSKVPVTAAPWLFSREGLPCDLQEAADLRFTAMGEAMASIGCRVIAFVSAVVSNCRGFA